MIIIKKDRYLSQLYKNIHKLTRFRRNLTAKHNIVANMKCYTIQNRPHNTDKQP